MPHQPDIEDKPGTGRNQTGPLPVNRLKKRADFLRAAKGVRAVTPGLVLQCHPSGETEESGAARIGFTATKKLGGAVVRNRVKRRLRAAAARVMPEHARPGFDYVLIGRGATARRPFALLVSDLERAVKQVHRSRTGRPRRASRKT